MRYQEALTIAAVALGTGGLISYTVFNDRPNDVALCYAVEQHWAKWTAWYGGGNYYRTMAFKSRQARAAYPTQEQYEKAYHWLSMQDDGTAADIANDCLLEGAVAYDHLRE